MNEILIIGESATATQLGIGVVVLVGLMSALLLGIKLKKEIVPGDESVEVTQVKVTPSPLPIHISDKFATKEELQDVKKELRELEKALPETEHRILAAIDRSSEKIERTVNKMAEVATAGRRKLYDKSLKHSKAIAKLETNTKRTEHDLRDFKAEFK